MKGCKCCEGTCDCPFIGSPFGGRNNPGVPGKDFVDYDYPYAYNMNCCRAKMICGTPMVGTEHIDRCCKRSQEDIRKDLDEVFELKKTVSTKETPTIKFYKICRPIYLHFTRGYGANNLFGIGIEIKDGLIIRHNNITYVYHENIIEIADTDWNEKFYLDNKMLYSLNCEANDA